MLTFATVFTLLKVFAWFVVLGSLYGFRRGKFPRIRTKLLALLGIASALIIIFSRTIFKNDWHEDYEWLFNSVFIATPVIAIYWVFKGIKDWLDPRQAKDDR